MYTPSTPFQPLDRRERAMVTVAALTASVSVVGALVLSLGSASPESWLTPTTALPVRLSSCDEQQTRQARDCVKQQLVTAALASEKHDLQPAGP